MKAAIDNIVGALSNHPGNTGLVVGVISRDHRSVFGYGKASNASAELPSGDTLFEIGSITKVFTTSLLAILTADGLLNLNDPVRDLMPSLSNLPGEITLLRLATHTAGLPKMPSNLFRSMLRNRRNPYAAYSTADLLLYLSSYKPQKRRRATDQINYSNLSVALLGHILAQSSGLPYEQAIVSRLCDKLAMHDTRIELTPEQQERLSPPHSANGKSVLNWSLPAFAGAGALRSTADDMLKFLAASLGRSQSPLTDVLQLCHEVCSEAFLPHRHLRRSLSGLFQREQDTRNHRQGIALGWFVGHLGPVGKRVHWHHGATGGYQAFTGFVKSTETGVVVLANRGPGRLDLISLKTPADDIGFRVLEYLNSVAQ
jgi:D-alanyl-D-alanine-carboxypeptidase/D-alanyl-D-alanine-endopeptidase